jgi:hypothetical protein
MIKLYQIPLGSTVVLNVVGEEGKRRATYKRLDGSYGILILEKPLSDGREMCHVYFGADFIKVDDVYEHSSLHKN